jgi:hypothetical protein
MRGDPKAASDTWIPKYHSVSGPRLRSWSLAFLWALGDDRNGARECG